MNVLDRIEIEMEGREDKQQDLYYFGFTKAPLLVDLSNCVFLCFTDVDGNGQPIATLVIKEKDDNRRQSGRQSKGGSGSSPR